MLTIRLYGADRSPARKKPGPPSVTKGTLAAFIRPTVGPAPPLATITPWAGFTMPTSEARMERTGPATLGRLR